MRLAENSQNLVVDLESGLRVVTLKHQAKLYVWPLQRDITHEDAQPFFEPVLNVEQNQLFVIYLINILICVR